MKRNPYLDRILPPGASKERIDFVLAVMVPAMPIDQKEYVLEVLEANKKCSKAARHELKALRTALAAIRAEENQKKEREEDRKKPNKANAPHVLEYRPDPAPVILRPEALEQLPPAEQPDAGISVPDDKPRGGNGSQDKGDDEGKKDEKDKKAKAQ
jgi:hypothetical protein